MADMLTSEKHVLQQEHQELLNQFKELLQKSKYLVTVVDSLKQENGQLRDEIHNLQNHSKGLVLKLKEQINTEEASVVSGVNDSVGYLLSRNRTGVRPNQNSITTTEPKVCMISSLPKSGTWSMQYFWSVFDSLCDQKEKYDPYNPFYLQLNGIKVDLFVIAHFFCPGYGDHIPEDLRQKYDAIQYPRILDVDWGSRYMKEHGLVDVCSPQKNKNAKIAFIYRNPLDQIVSYTRTLWDNREPIRGAFDCTLDKRGNTIKMHSLKQYIRQVGAASYIYYFLTYLVMRDVMGENLLFMRYEDMINNRYDKYKELAKFFLGSDYNDTLDDNLKQSLEITKIENMKMLESSTGKPLMHHYSTPRKSFAHVRDGSIGRWKEVIDGDDVDYIMDLLDDFGISKDYFTFE